MNQDNVIPFIEIDSLTKEIECIMCLNMANDARMCIHCSAIVCANCIENWINRRNVCPKCSNRVQQTDFVKCLLVNKLIDSIEISKLHTCSIHSKETPRVYCTTCQSYVCFDCILINGEHIDHNYKHIDEDYKQILKLNHKLIGFLRRRCKQNQDDLSAIELAIQNNTHQQTTEALSKETGCLFDDYQRKKQVYNDAIRNDQLIINDVERRLKESKGLSDQEEILQILQKHIPSKVE